MKPVRLSTSKSCAARVDVMGRGARKWDGFKAMAIRLDWVGIRFSVESLPNRPWF